MQPRNKAQFPSAERLVLPPSPTLSVSALPPFFPWTLHAREPVAPKVLSPQSWEALRGLAGAPASHTLQPARVSCCCPSTHTCPPSLPAPYNGTALGHRAPSQRVFLFFTASGQFFIIVSGFVLRNKKNFHIIFNFMIKPSIYPSVCSFSGYTKSLASPYPLQSPHGSQVSGDRPVWGGVGGRMGNGEASAISLIF